MASLKTGDSVLIKGVVKRIELDGKIHIKIGDNRGWAGITEADIESIQHNIKVGDRVRKRDQSMGGWVYGSVLALQEDTEPTNAGRVWAWVKFNHTWVRSTCDVTELERV